MSVARIGVVLVLLIFLGSCDVSESEKNACALSAQLHPTELFEGELSYSKYENYKSLFSDPSFHWIEKEGDFGKSSVSVSRFEVNRKFLGYTGKLEYVFYFQRLAEMRFHPDNPSLFFQAAKAKGLPVSFGAELAAGDAKYWTTGRHGVVETIAVSDRRIIRSFQACIAAHD